MAQQALAAQAAAETAAEGAAAAIAVATARGDALETTLVDERAAALANVEQADSVQSQTAELECALPHDTHTDLHTHTYTRSLAHTHTHAHAHTHAHGLAHTRTRTRTCTHTHLHFLQSFSLGPCAWGRRAQAASSRTQAAQLEARATDAESAMHCMQQQLEAAK